MKKIIFLIITLNSFYLCSAQYSQVFQDIKSPEVSSFERYGNQKISKYNGTPDFSIPLCTINHGDIAIPLQITYNTNGIRVDEEASQFGLGWYFGTGMISQIRNGKNDLRPEVFVEQPDYYTGTMGYIIDPYTGETIKQPSSPNNTLDQYFVARIRDIGEVFDRFDCFNVLGYDGKFFYPKNNVAKNYFNVAKTPNANEDFEIDYFKAVFFGHEITFFINPRANATAPYTFCVINQKKYKIQLSNGNWIITDPSGIEYYFEERKNAQSNSISNMQLSPSNTSEVALESINFFPDMNYQQTSTTWKITKIKDTKGNEIVFNYEQLPNSRFKSASYNYELKNLTVGYELGHLENYNEYFGPINKYIEGNGIYVAGIKDYTEINYYNTVQTNSILSNITFGNSKIDFNNTSRIDSPYDKKTESISVFYNNELKESINLSFDYFNVSSADNLQKRLKLVNLSVNNNKPYQFIYNTIDTPNKNTLSFDYWGFYNGMPNTSGISNPFRLFEDISSIPSWAKQYIPLLDGKCNRSAHPDYCKAGMLEEIHYPTGGFTKIEYELNEFDNYYFPDYNNRIGFDSQNNFAVNYTQNKSKGFGLRVKNVKDYTNENSYISHLYIYRGGKHITPFIGYRSTNVSYQEYAGLYSGGSQIGTYNVKTVYGPNISSYSSLLYQNNLLGNGNSIGYDSVEVIETNSTGNNKGKIISYFTNVPDLSPIQKFDNGYSSSIGFNPHYFDRFGASIRNSDIDNGLLTKEEYFDKNNNLVLKKDMGYSSTMFPNTIKFNLKLVPTSNYFRLRGVDCVSGGDSYTEIKYFNFTEYLLFYFPLKLSNTKLAGITTTEYFGSNSITTNEYHNYDNNHVYTGKSITSTNVDYSDNLSMLSNSFTQSKNILSTPQRQFINQNGVNKLTKEYEYLEVNNSLELKKEHILPDGNPDPTKKITTFYDSYDDKHNVTQYHKDGDKYVSVIWGYNKTLPVAKIENLQYSQIQSGIISAIQQASDTAGEQEVLNQLNNLRSSLSSFPNIMITTYTHKPLIGVSTITDGKGDKKTFEYDSSNRLKYVKDINGNILSENEYHFKP